MHSFQTFINSSINTPLIQAQLKVGEPGDKYEREADALANRVMSMPQTENSIQRACVSCSENELQMKPMSEHVLQMQAVEEEEELLQPKLRMQPMEEEEEMLQPKSMGSPSGELNEIALTMQSTGNGSSLPDSTNRFMSNAFGSDFRGVKIHTGSKAIQMNNQLGARAFTHGNNIYFNKGQYTPKSSEGKKLLAHELTHVVQQGAGGSRDSISKHEAPNIQAARLPCTSKKKIDVFTVNLPGSSRSIYSDISTTNDILCQCGIEIVLKGGESWDTNLMDKEAPKGVLNEFKSTGKPTQEEKELLSYRPGGDMLHLYYVPALSDGNEAEAFNSSGFPSVNNGLVVSNKARIFAFAHELGHVLLDDGSHHSNTDNLMASGDVNSGKGELTESQCAKMP